MDVCKRGFVYELEKQIQGLMGSDVVTIIHDVALITARNIISYMLIRGAP